MENVTRLRTPCEAGEEGDDPKGKAVDPPVNDFGIAKLPKDAYTEREARALFRQVLEALAHLHDGERIVHRDIKPDNLMVESATRRVVLIDFNISCDLREKMTQEAGLPQFTAPEMYDNGGRGYDEKVDVWSAGVVLYLMLSGRLPFNFDGQLEEEILNNKLISEPDYSNERFQ